MNIKTLAASVAACALLTACTGANETSANTQATEKTASSEQTESQRLNNWFQEKFEQSLSRSPMFKTYLGIKDEDYGKWDDPSPAFAQKEHAIALADYAQRHAKFDYDKLDDAAKLSWRLADFNYEREVASWQFHDYGYIFNQMFGTHASIPAFLINQHQIKSADHATAYISRLNGVKAYLGGQTAKAKTRFEKGIYPPKFVYARVLDASRNIVKGAPFDDGPDSAIFADFKGKVDALSLGDEEKTDLITKASAAMTASVGPAYQNLITEMERQQSLADDKDGAWKLPDGAAYYRDRLAAMTTTDMSAEEIHNLGLSEVARIHDEMRTIMQAVGFDGDLQAFFTFMREDPQFYYPDTDEGRAAYLAKAVSIIETMRARLDDIFVTKPKAEIIVKAVEPFREATAGKAFYQRPSLDGSRPGTYYANLYRMESMPTYQMEALAYHEGIPGHHMQGSVAQELENIPMFRKLGGYTAYSEGWGLYSEFIPKEMGFYADPYSDFGRLSMELWRAARLVVDTGLHDKRWTRQQAIDYLSENTPNSLSDATNAIERYIVMPGQATAYKIGMLEILRLRQRAQEELGDKFDLREYHDVVLANGAVPLSVLGDLVDEWIARKKEG
ncbi:MAG: DUF885 domain-containing protein [Robiginitomaculum sp.]|nr:MAG: DUF885 domain-containing protein [Robiginitomaculum sp.]